MRSGKKTALWMGAASGGAVAVAGLVISLLGSGPDGLKMSLFVTGRIAFLLFWGAYAGPALASLFGPAFSPLKRHAREFGLAFASVIAVHVTIVAWLSLIGAAPGFGVFVRFGIALGWTMLLAALSFGRPAQWFGASGWWAIRFVGMNYILYAFATDFVHGPLSGGLVHVAEYLPFAVLSVAAPSVRAAAFLQRLGRSWRTALG